MWETAKFNTRLQVTELGLGNSATDASVWKTNYEYGELQTNGAVDGAKNTGNIARQTLSFDGLAQPFVVSYKYDSLYRLTEAVEKTGSTANWSQQFGYDRYGNRTGINQAIGSLTLNKTPAVDAATNRFTSGQGFVYDKNGNVVGDTDINSSLPRQFTFNGDNKQTEVKKDGVTVGRYFYDGEGKRIKKKTYAGGVLNEETVFVYDAAGKLVAEYSSEIASVNDAKVAYLTNDHLGSPRVITDAAGQVKSRRDYHPFGDEIGTLNGGSPHRTTALNYTTDSVRQKFTGYERDNETHLDYAKARMYGYNHGRFTSPDPAKMLKERMADPQHWNLYVYARNNPLLMVDITGEFPWTFHIRSFIYTSTTGGGLFRGDGRGPSLTTDSREITSRVRLNFTLDYQKGQITNSFIKSDPTVFYGIAGTRLGPTAAEGSPGVQFGNVETYNRSKGVSLHYWGKDPITPGFATPNLDVHANIAITESITKHGNGSLFINGTFTGDKFPSTEAFIVDQSGKTKLFLGAKLEQGGVSDLYGDNKQDLFKVDIQVKFDRKGNFTAVIQDGKTYTVDQWNKRVQAQF